MGNAEILAQTAAKTSGNPYLFPIIIVALFGLLYFVMIRPQRNRQRQVMQMQSGIVPGQRVRTTAGMYATVVSMEDGDVVLEIAPGVHVRCLRRAIMDVVPADTGVGAAGPSVSDEGAAGGAGSTGSAAGTGSAESGSAAE
jgi:preprotein translocase subunit YajC